MTKETIDQLRKALKSKDNSIVLKTIQKIRDKGNNKLLPDLVNLYESSEDKDVLNNISNLLGDIHNQESAEILIKLVQKTTLVKSRKMILSACWQSRIDFIDYLETIIDIAITEPFEISFEAFTIIENIETKVNAARKAELINYAKSKIDLVIEENISFAPEIVHIMEHFVELEG